MITPDKLMGSKPSDEDPMVEKALKSAETRIDAHLLTFDRDWVEARGILVPSSLILEIMAQELLDHRQRGLFDTLLLNRYRQHWDITFRLFPCGCSGYVFRRKGEAE